MDGTQSYSHYFMPPLPENLVVFALNRDKIFKEPLEAKISIDSSIEEKVVGELDNKALSFVSNLSWSEEEKLLESQVVQDVSYCLIF